jgi:hypothetical protein
VGRKPMPNNQQGIARVLIRQYCSAGQPPALVLLLSRPPADGGWPAVSDAAHPDMQHVCCEMRQCSSCDATQFSNHVQCVMGSKMAGKRVTE